MVTLAFCAGRLRYLLVRAATRVLGLACARRTHCGIAQPRRLGTFPYRNRNQQNRVTPVTQQYSSRSRTQSM